MTTARKAATPRASRPRTPSLPSVTTARFECALRLVEVVLDEQTDTFIAKAQEYRARHRDGTSRQLDALESAQVASGLAATHGLPPVTLAVAVQESDLRAYDEPQPVEILLAAGAATAPAFMDAVKRFTALIEMPADLFRAAFDDDTVDEQLDVAVNAMAHEDLKGAAGMRARAQHAYEHFARESADAEGKEAGLLLRIAWQAVQQATTALNLRQDQPPSSLTGSPPDTAGLAETSSTTSATQTP